MTRGNQRERDRQKAQKSAAGKTKTKANDGLSVTKRRELDAERIREKQLLKNAASKADDGDT